MRIIEYNDGIDLENILKRDDSAGEGVLQTVKDIIETVRREGDAALYDYTRQFDGARLKDLRVSPEEISEAREAVGDRLLSIYEEAAENIRGFHTKQLEQSWTYEPREGVTLGQKITPLERVGVYVPGGKAAYPSTVLMDTIPAQVAGVGSIAVVTPPGPDGKVDAHILAAASVAGVDEVYKVGGAQAVAALAYGTESIKPVHKIVGPGNIFVATAKREVFGKVDIDMIAGPSEVLVVADETANPTYIAADLLAQAEHDQMAMPILVTDDPTLPERVVDEIGRQISDEISRKDIAAASVDGYGVIFVVGDRAEAFDLANRIAPEHLELLVESPREAVELVRNAGAIFIGPNTPEPVGDYYAGPNHTLPTSGTAKFSSPLGVYDFQKRSSLLCYSPEALQAIGENVMEFARSEGLDAHANSVAQRLGEKG